MSAIQAFEQTMYPPLVQRLIDELGYPVLGREDLAGFVSDDQVGVLFFTEDARKYPETNDVAVVLPELVKHYQGRLKPAIILREDEKVLQKLYDFYQWPNLVFIRGQHYLGSIGKIRDWHVYLERIDALLEAEPTRPPGGDIPLLTA